VAPNYGIDPKYFNRRKFTEHLRRLGFKAERKQGGVSWFITRKVVDDVKDRMGMIESKQTTLDSSSFSSDSSDSSDSFVTPTNKTEPNELNESNEPKISPLSIMYKSESNEPSELNEKNESSDSSDKKDLDV